MFFGINSSLSGLRVNAEKMRFAANNIANINTPSYKATSPVVASVANSQGAVVTSIKKDNSAGSPQFTGSNLPSYSQSSNVDMPREIVAILEAKQAFKANAKVIKAADELLKSTLDILA